MVVSHIRCRATGSGGNSRTGRGRPDDAGDGATVGRGVVVDDGGNRWPILLFSRSELLNRGGDCGPPAISQTTRHPTHFQLVCARFNGASYLLHVVFGHALRIDHILAIGCANLNLPRLHTGVITLKKCPPWPSGSTMLDRLLILRPHGILEPTVARTVPNRLLPVVR